MHIIQKSLGIQVYQLKILLEVQHDFIRGSFYSSHKNTIVNSTWDSTIGLITLIHIFLLLPRS